MKRKGLGDVTRLALGDGRSCALLSDGSVRCWGMNDYGELGPDDAANLGIPGPIVLR